METIKEITRDANIIWLSYTRRYIEDLNVELKMNGIGRKLCWNSAF